MSDRSRRKSVNSRRSFFVGVSDVLVAAAPTTGLPTIHADRRLHHVGRIALHPPACYGAFPTQGEQP